MLSKKSLGLPSDNIEKSLLQSNQTFDNIGFEQKNSSPEKESPQKENKEKSKEDNEL